jgi:hypothetical protein
MIHPPWPQDITQSLPVYLWFSYSVFLPAHLFLLKHRYCKIICLWIIFFLFFCPNNPKYSVLPNSSLTIKTSLPIIYLALSLV